MKDQSSIFRVGVCLKAFFCAVLLVGGALPVAYAADTLKSKTGHYKVLNTKECLSFLENEDGDQLSTHLLPQSYSRCLELTRKIKKRRVIEAESKAQSNEVLEGEGVEPKAMNKHISKNYYRVMKRETEKAKEPKSD